jgi:hypothetical protein
MAIVHTHTIGIPSSVYTHRPPRCVFAGQPYLRQTQHLLGRCGHGTRCHQRSHEAGTIAIAYKPRDTYDTAQPTVLVTDRTGASCGEMMAVSALCAKESEKEAGW